MPLSAYFIYKRRGIFFTDDLIVNIGDIRKMKIDSIQNGIVLDHITAGKAMQIYYDLGLDKLSCSVALIQKVNSRRWARRISSR